jgi:hypothetical protein
MSSAVEETVLLEGPAMEEPVRVYSVNIFIHCRSSLVIKKFFKYKSRHAGLSDINCQYECFQPEEIGVDQGKSFL